MATTMSAVVLRKPRLSADDLPPFDFSITLTREVLEKRWRTTSAVPSFDPSSITMISIFLRLERSSVRIELQMTVLSL